MPAGERFVICGLSRLTVRVARSLAARDADVVVVAGQEGGDLALLLNEPIRVLRAGGDREEALRAAGLDAATCLLALADDDLDNLQTAVSGDAVAPHVPVVIRAFDPALVDQLEGSLNVRRAFSVSALAAPSFVAAALSEAVIQTLRLGDEEIPLCRLTLHPRSPIAGKTAIEVKAVSHCATIAFADPSGTWHPAAGDIPTLPDEGGVVVGGRLLDVLRLALAHNRATTPRRASRPAPPRPARPKRRGRDAQTLLPVTALVLLLLLSISVVVFAVTLDKGPVDALYFAVTTALGNSTLDDSQAWLKVFGVGTMVAGGALLGVVFSYLASVATTSRLEERMGRRAKRLSGHVVVAGLGTVGYRVERLLFELGVPVAVIDRAPDPRFVDAVGERVPVLSGDVRLSETLERAGVQDAFCLMACTDDDLTNVAACMEARRINPDIRTVARIFDERLAARVAGAFGIDAAVSATQVAAGAFVGAATDERALRSFIIGDREFLSLRHVLPADMPHDLIVRWRQDGVRILAFQHPDGVVQPPSALTGGLPAGSAAIVAGPAEAVRSVVLEG